MQFFPFLFVISAVNALSHAVDQSPNVHPLSALRKRELPIGTCNSATPCPNGACCGSNNLCGYSPTECGTGCTSNCDAKAECGEYGASGQQNCPLNVCCSKFGFCGETDDFCGTGCQKGYGDCGPPPTPACGGTKVGQRTIGYYESWANTRKCQAVSPEDLNLAGFTHLNFAFASFDPNSFKIAPMDPNSAGLFGRVTALKSKWPGLQVWISVGGWAFTDPGSTREAFSNMVSTGSNRQAFISALQQFMATYNFDGVDLDWEYPQATDRGGNPGDKENYVTFTQELRAALGSKGISMTLPTSYWYLQHFDVKSLQDSVDWFNFMAYDLHGVWDGTSRFVGPYIRPHTNLTEINEGLQLLWRAGVEANKVVLGQAWYGRSFTLKDPSCSTPNGICEFSGGANPGPCSDTSGILDDQEINDIISSNNLSPIWDHTAGIKYITWDQNQWVSYDDADTFNQKMEFAKSNCLGGLMVWAIDQKDQTASGNLNSGSHNEVSSSDQSTAKQMSLEQAAKSSCYVTDCGQKCKKGTNQVAQMNGQPGQVSTRDRCPKNKYRSLCCDDGTTLGKCSWSGFRGAGLSCISGCPEGQTELTTDTNNHQGKKDQTCNGGLQSFCCDNFKPPPTKGEIEQDAGDLAKGAAESVAQQAALDVAAKAFCRLAVPALLAPLEALEDLIPIIGEIADAIEIGLTPELVNLCTKEIEKTGKAELKIFGKHHDLEPPKEPGSDTPPEDRPPESSHPPEKTSSDSCNRKRAGNGNCISTVTQTETNQPVRTDHPGVIKICDGALYPQPCLHYQSVIAEYGDLQQGFNPLTCAPTYRPKIYRPAVYRWKRQHKPSWWKGYIQEFGANCQADEYPPIAFFWHLASPTNPAWIRLLPGAQNGGAGQLFRQKSICGYDDRNQLPKSSANLRSDREYINGNRKTIIETVDVTVVQKTVEVRFRNLPDLPDDGILANPCWPSTVVNDPGFALLTNDAWYVEHAEYASNTAMYGQPPANALVAGKSRAGYQKRWEREDEDYPVTAHIAEESYPWLNTTHEFVDEEQKVLLVDDELADHLNLKFCTTPDCSEEIAETGGQGLVIDVQMAKEMGLDLGNDDQVAFIAPHSSASSTTTIEAAVVLTSATAASGAQRAVPDLPMPTR